MNRLMHALKSKHLLPFVVLSIILVGFRSVIVSYGVLTVPDKFQDFITLSVSVFIEAFPFLVLGSLLAAIVGTYVPPKTFDRFLPKNGILKRATLSLFGFMFPVCECGNVPLSRALMIQGLKPSEAITFLLSAPVLNPVTIWSTWAAFRYDPSIVSSRIVATLIIANIIGFVISQKKDEYSFLTRNFAAQCKTPHHNTHQKSKRASLTKVSVTFTHEAFTMIKMLAFGALIAGVVQTFVPREILVNIGSNVILSIIAMLLLAFVVSICASVDAFFALSFASTFTAGSLVSFLVFGPMIDIKMLALLKTTFRTKPLVVITVLALLLSMLSGLVVTYAF